MEPYGKHFCKSTRADGKPCKGMARAGGFCFAHSPDMTEQRTQARLKGGHNSSNAARLQKLMPARLVPVFLMMEGILGDVYNDKIVDYKKAQTMALVARTMVAVFTAGELEERLRALEEKIEKDHPRLGVLR